MLRDRIKQGLIAVMSCVEPCRTWRMRGDHESKRLELRLEWGKCKHYYFYWMHEEVGFLHLRLQTSFPFLIQVCVNGREWLGRQMDREGIGYRKEDNCFPWIGDVGRAQKLMEEQHERIGRWCEKSWSSGVIRCTRKFADRSRSGITGRQARVNMLAT